MKSFRDQIRELKRKVRERAETIADAKVRVYIDPDAKYPNGKRVEDVGRYVEYGTSSMAPRPFIRTAMQENSAAWRESLHKAVLMVATGKGNNYKAVLKGSADLIARDVKSSCEEFGAVDTGLLRDSVKSEVVSNG